jgi:tRNA threonylcarbamoyladenosine biosynthesis protein TsaE
MLIYPIKFCTINQVDKKYTTNSYRQTQKLGEKLATEILLSRTSQKTAVVLALKGNLGGGKTTFLQGFAKGLGIKEKILSPTFVIMKHFKITKNSKFEIRNSKFTDFYHIDCYRISGTEEILELGFKTLIKNPGNIVALEWPEKIKKVLPKDAVIIEFKFINENTREIKFKI